MAFVFRLCVLLVPLLGAVTVSAVYNMTYLEELYNASQYDNWQMHCTIATPEEYATTPNVLDHWSPWDPADYSAIVPGSKNTGDTCGKVDICFTVDNSTSLGPYGFQWEIQTIRRLVAELVMRFHEDFPAQYSAWSFDQVSVPEDQIQALSPDYQSLLTDLNDLYYHEFGCTNITAALARCEAELKAGDPDRAKVLFLVTDGHQTVDAGMPGITGPHAKAIANLVQAQQLKDDGIILFPAYVHYRITNTFRGDILRDMASQLNGEPLYTTMFLNDIDNLLDDFVEYMVHKTCEAIPHPTPECSCSPYSSGTAGTCVQDHLSTAPGGGSGVCTHQACAATSLKCDVVSPTHRCYMTPETIWVCDPDGVMNSTHCDCIMANRTRVVLVD